MSSIVAPNHLVFIHLKLFDLTFVHNSFLVYCGGQFVKEGVLKHTSLGHIWSNYPKENRHSLLQILEMFDIALPVCTSSFLRTSISLLTNNHQMPYEDKVERKYLIPTLLPLDSPPDTPEWPTYWVGHIFSRVFQFKFLPCEFIPRLIIRTLRIPLLETVAVWSTGVIVKFEDVRVMLKYQLPYRVT